jgi:hypothetical protein
VDVEVSRNSRCRVEVELTWPDGPSVTGAGGGNATPQGRALAGAEATRDALSKATGAALDFELRGIRLVRAFDSLLVIVAVRARVADRRVDLIGATVAPGEDVTRGAVHSFLDATNRLLEKYAEPPSESAE